MMSCHVFQVCFAQIALTIGLMSLALCSSTGNVFVLSGRDCTTAMRTSLLLSPSSSAVMLATMS